MLQNNYHIYYFTINSKYSHNEEEKIDRIGGTYRYRTTELGYPLVIKTDMPEDMANEVSDN